MRPDLYILVPEVKPALKYVLDFVFGDFYGLTYKLITASEDYPDKTNIIAYGLSRNGALTIGSSGYLFQDDLLDYPDLGLITWEGLPIFFPVSENDLPFDLFGAIFLLLGRVEEYGDFFQDSHQRFTAAASIFKDSDIVERPIIDEWLIAFGKIIKLKFPDLDLEKRRFRWVNTFDIDIAFAYKNRGPLRILGGSAKDIVKGNWERTSERLSVLLNQKEDPYDTFEFQKKVASDIADETVYFFLVGGSTKYDNGLSPLNPGMRQLITHIKTYSDVGLHPSYDSMQNLEILLSEKNVLESCLESPIQKSRQHFLRMRLPDSYRNLVKAGIEVDYTMGFVDNIGFRSGTTRTHLFFDVKENRITDLKIVPLHMMDGTLRDYLKLSPTQAKEVLFQLIQKVYDVKGDFVSLWHNDVLSRDPKNGWRQLYSDMAEYINDLKSKDQHLV